MEDPMHVRLLLATASLSAVILLAYPTAAQEAHLSQKQLSALLKKAHTANEFRELCDYYHVEAERFHTMERAEYAEMEKEQRAGTATKSPSRYDHARNLHMYYKSKWEESVAQEKLYSGKLENVELSSGR
jgi:hypothetical protein